MAKRGLAAPDGTKGAFLAAVALGKSIEQAARIADIATGTLYRWKVVDDEFAADWERAKQVRREIRAEKGWQTIDRIADNPKHARQFDAAKFQVERGEQGQTNRLEVTGHVEVDHGAIAAAVETLTARILSPTPPGGTDEPLGLDSERNQGPLALGVGRVDSEAEPEGT